MQLPQEYEVYSQRFRRDDLEDDKTFTEEQMKWLGYIREYLIENLTIDLDDFNVMPTFELHGGIAKAKKVFDNKLETLIAEINFAIAA